MATDTVTSKREWVSGISLDDLGRGQRQLLHGPVVHPDDLPFVQAAARAGEVLAATSGRQKPGTGEKGVTGLDVRSGKIYQEYSTRLRDLQTRMVTYEEMRRSESACAAMEALITLPVVHTQFWIEPGDDKEFSEFVSWNIWDGLTHDFMDTVRSAILAILYGFTWHHKVFEKKDGGKWGWRKFADRERSTVKKWKFDSTGGLAGLTQWGRDPLTGTMNEVDYDISEILVWTWQKEANNPEGIGAFRRAFKSYSYLQAFEEFAAIRIERQSMGVPIAYGPEEGYDVEERDAVLAILSNFRVAHDAGLVAPQGWRIELLDLGAADVPFESHIERQRQDMLQTVLGQFVGLGQGGDSGAFALSRDSSSLFLMAEESIADWIGGRKGGVFNRYAIPQLADFRNERPMRKGPEKLPRLMHGKVGVRDLDRFTRAIETFYRHPETIPEEVEEYWREEMGLPVARQTRKQKAAEDQAAAVEQAAAVQDEGNLAPPTLPEVLQNQTGGE